jgi:Ca2+-binding EF-hand superfamily protein
MFELLDEDHTGMLSAKNLRTFMETAERIKKAGFDIVKYEGDLARN